ncbi:MAG: 3'-5' exonuclease [Candidatus Peribacteraceae bacterium]|nr:3'-5' exonuclease [Candidatus Peribacteraceae bacterium]
MKSIILDTETTGLPQKNAPLEMQPHIIEIGAIFIDDSGAITRTISQLLNPGDKIYDDKIKTYTNRLPAIITKVTGIVDEDLVGKPTFKEFLPILSTFFIGADALIAHNAQFDVKMLENELRRSEVVGFEWPVQTICTMHEYKHLLSGKWPKLIQLYEKIMRKKLEQTHRALDDCMAVREILVEDKYFEKIAEPEELFPDPQNEPDGIDK